MSKLLERLESLPNSTSCIPVTIVTGFLGSGKTTLLNALLKSPPLGRRIAVIENERGAIPLDHELLVGANESRGDLGDLKVLLLSNGCMCCSTSDSLGKNDMERSLEALLELAAPRSGKVTASGDGMADHVVVELSGLADPAPLIHALLRLGVAGRGRFYLAGCVAVVDAKNIAYHLDGRGLLSRASESGQQVAFADLVLLNKVDTATPSEILRALQVVEAVNPTARVVQCIRAAVDPELVLNQGALDPVKALGLLGGSMSLQSPPPAAKHSRGVVCLTLHLPPPPLQSPTHDLPKEGALMAWLQETMEENASRLYRVKGLVPVESKSKSNSIEVLFLQGVHGSLQVARTPLEVLRKGRGNSAFPPMGIVLIGKGLDVGLIRSNFYERVLDRLD